jgi:hypothetical protein
MFKGINNDEDIYENINLYKIQHEPCIQDESSNKLLISKGTNILNDS